MPLSRKSILPILLLSLCSQIFCQQIESNIFLITIGCGFGCKQKIQTGFRLANAGGIITTLHGLAGATNITAEIVKHYGQTEKRYTNLKIKKVDFERDIVLISNSDLDKELQGGLQRVQQFTSGNNGNYSSYGHPDGTSLVPRNDIKLASPAVITLNDRIPPTDYALYEKRNSPNLKTRVIEMRYNFGNGESGAPILNKDNQVIGINDGGFASINVSWAIPITDINLSDKIDMKKINGLLDVPIMLHSYQIDIENLSAQPIQTLADKFQNWYFGLVKLYNKYLSHDGTVLDPNTLFDGSTLSKRFTNALDVNYHKYYSIYESFPRLLGLYEHPIKITPVNIDQKSDDQFAYTVFLQYDNPLYAFKYTPKNNIYGLEDAFFHYTTDIDFILRLNKQGRIGEYKKANVQMIFILDKNLNLVEITGEILTVFPGDKYYQNR